MDEMNVVYDRVEEGTDDRERSEEEVLRKMIEFYTKHVSRYKMFVVEQSLA